VPQIAADPSNDIARLRASGLLLERAYLGGQWVDADDGATFAVFDPATGDELAQVPRLGAAETQRAIACSSGCVSRLAIHAGKGARPDHAALVGPDAGAPRGSLAAA
jgi:hypothetical protein